MLHLAHKTIQQTEADPKFNTGIKFRKHFFVFWLFQWQSFVRILPRVCVCNKITTHGLMKRFTFIAHLKIKSS